MACVLEFRQVLIGVHMAKSIIKQIIYLLLKAIVCWIVIILTTYGWQPLFPKNKSNIVPLDAHTVVNLHSSVKILSQDIGMRNVMFPGHLNKAAEFIVKSFQSSGYTVIEQEYRPYGRRVKNIIAYLGDDFPQESIIVGAHYDTCMTPGADDNASGVAGLLELARQMKGVSRKTPVVFVAFVNEEPPFFTTNEMGSYVFAKYLKKNQKSVKAAVILEMLGFYNEGFASQRYLPLLGPFYPNQANFITVVGNYSSSGLVHHLVKGMSQGTDFSVQSIVAPSFVPGIYFSDHWSFWKMGYPAVMVTDTAYLRYKHYHKYTDTIEKLNFVKMGYCLQGLRYGIEQLSNEK